MFYFPSSDLIDILFCLLTCFLSNKPQKKQLATWLDFFFFFFSNLQTSNVERMSANFCQCCHRYSIYDFFFPVIQLASFLLILSFIPCYLFVHCTYSTCSVLSRVILLFFCLVFWNPLSQSFLQYLHSVIPTGSECLRYLVSLLNYFFFLLLKLTVINFIVHNVPSNAFRSKYPLFLFRLYWNSV